MELETTESIMQECNEEITSYQAEIRPISLEFNLASQSAVVQPSPVQDVISILERHLAEADRKKAPDDDSKWKVPPEGVPHVNTSFTDESKQKDFLDNISNIHITSLDMLQNEEKAQGGSDTNFDLSERTDCSLKKIKDEKDLFTCVMVNKNGIPDYSKMMKLDTNIIKEVLEKHGIKMKDVSGDAGEKSTQGSKKKKKKKKTEKEKTPVSKKITKIDKTINCTQCDKTFHRERNLRDHMRYHNKRNFSCRHCTYVAVRQKELEYHLNSHTGSKPFTCDICQKGFSHPAVLASHNKTHRGHTGAVTCKVCRMQFTQPHLLDRHMISHDENRPHICQYCPMDFKRHMDLRTHIKLYHTEVPVDIVAPRRQPLTTGDFKCDQCERSFKTDKGLDQHQRRTHNSRSVMEWTEVESIKLTCNHCAKTFESLKMFNKHKVMHSTLRPYTCKMCGRSYKRQWELHKHKLIHSDNDPLPCTLCKAEFPGMVNLRRHMKRIHQGGAKKPAPKPFVCDVCSRAYARQVELNEHKNIHTGARPYVCDSCGKTFSFRSSLACHRKLHREEDAIPCDICGKRFGSKIRMREHRVIHTGEKPYVCQQCNVGYRYPSNLRWHLNNGTCGKVRKKLSGNKVKKTKSSVKAPSQPDVISSQQQPVQLQELQPAPPTMEVWYPTGEEPSQTGAETFQGLPSKPEAKFVNQEDVLTVVLQTPVGDKILRAASGGFVIETLL